MLLRHSVCLCGFLVVYQPELAASAHTVIPALRAVMRAACVVMRVSIGNVEAEALLTAPLLRHQPISMIVGQPILFFQAA